MIKFEDKISSIRFVIIGLIIALVGEVFDNLIVNHRPVMMFAIIIPIYALFFFLIFLARKNTKLSSIVFVLFFGTLMWLFLENLILRKFVEPWPIQIFMLCYWVSLIGYPFLFIGKKYKGLMIAFTIALVVGLISYFTGAHRFLSFAIFQFSFWISSAIILTIALIKYEDYQI